MTQTAPLPCTGRIDALDLARGIAVLGIVAINMPAFAGPALAVSNPDWNETANRADFVVFSANFLWFEGKMRSLFSLLFGAGLVLFLARRGTWEGTRAQLRRLFWLALFGYAHFALLWWGDILFLYAVAGAIALFFVSVSPGRLVVLGVSGALFYTAITTAMAGPTLLAAEALHSGEASAQQQRLVAGYTALLREEITGDFAEYSRGMAEQIAFRLAEKPFYPFRALMLPLFETLPLMLIGMGLAKGGFFTGSWRRAALLRLGLAGLLAGLAWAAVSLWWLNRTGFALAPSSLLAFYTGLPGRMAMSIGYLALIAAFAPAIMRSRIGNLLAAAGRMAFTNYLLTSLAMTFVFHGWGLGWIDRLYGHATLMVFTLAVWAAMLAWSAPWLARFKIGPLEGAWRVLAQIGRPRRKRD